MSPRLIAWLIAPAVGVVLLYGIATFLRRNTMFFPARYPAGFWDPGALNPRPADENFVTDDGVKLHGWLFRAAAANAPVMVWFHGNGGNITDRASIAANFAQRGISVFVFDWRGYGRSEGVPTEDGLFHDALAAYDFAKAHLGSDIVAYGESLGGPYAAYVASKRRVRCVVMENTFPSLRAIGNAHYPPLGWFAPNALNTTRWLNEARVPVLVMHGRRDDVIPFALGKSLFDDLKVPKRMLICDTAGHCQIPLVDANRYYETVVTFVRSPS